MKFMLAVALSLQAVVEAKMHLYFNKRFMGFGFDRTQRCYTISHCWNDHSKDSEWDGIPSPGQIVWYEDPHCAGDSMSRASSKGSINFADTKLYNKVSSFMVQQEGLYPTDGMVDYCHENGALNSTETLYFDLDDGGNAFA